MVRSLSLPRGRNPCVTGASSALGGGLLFAGSGQSRLSGRLTARADLPARHANASPARSPEFEGTLRMLSTIGGFAAKIFGSSNERRVQGLQPARRGDQCAGAEDVARLTDDELKLRTENFRAPARRGRHARRPAHPCLRHRARSRQAHARPAPFRRAADRRHGAARGQDRRDEDRRRQDARRHAARLSQCARRQGRPRRHRQRLPRTTRRRLDGARSTSSSGSPSATSCMASTTSSARRLTPATSPTPPTTSSASTTCATT